MEDLRQQLAAAFAAEHAEHVAAMRAALATAEAGGAPDLREFFRRAHSLKGAARAVDRIDLEELAHSLESLLAGLEERGALDPGTIEDLRGLLDAIDDAYAAPIDDASPMPDAEANPAGGEMLRVPARDIERLIRSIRALQADLDRRALIGGDLSATRVEIEATRRAASAPGASLANIAGRLARLAVSSAAVGTRRKAADGQVARAADALERDAGRLLLAPASGLAEGLERMVRTLAAEQGKHAALQVMDDGAEADRATLQALRDPITHLLRNAVSHGIELPAERARARKAEQGRITLSIRASGRELVLAIEDDGAGPNLARIEASARAAGLIGPDAPTPPPAALLGLVFAQGFSTATDVDRLSGRGVGLAIVAEAVRRLHGNVRMERGPQGGARFTITLPVGAMRRTALLVEAGGDTFALPARAIDRLVRIVPSAIERSGGVPSWRNEDGALTTILPLAALLGLTPSPGDAPLGLLLRRDEQSVLIAVDALIDVRALAFGDPAAIAIDNPLVVGTAALDGERLALVLSAEALLDRAARDGRVLAAAAPAASSAEPAPQRTALVVDDSITTRTLERGILEAAGYRVLLSVDGIDGLERLRGGETIDLVVADVEMPRLDGFGLVEAIRNDPALAAIPIIMMTSRNSPDDIRRGLDLGADAYVTKQEFEQGSLLAAIGRLV